MNKGLASKLGVAAVGLLVIAAFLTLELQNTPTTNEPVTVSTDELTLFPSGAPSRDFSLALWTVSVSNNINEVQSLVVALFSNGIANSIEHFSLNSSQKSSQTSCVGPFPNPVPNFTASILASSTSTTKSFNSSVTSKTAVLLPYSGQVEVVSSLANTSAISPGRGGSGQYNITIKNKGTNPIVLLYVELLNPNGSSLGASIFCGYHNGSFGWQTGSQQLPLGSGQSTTYSSGTFSPGVTTGKSYQFYFLIGYSDDTQVSFTSTVQAK